MVAQPQAKTLYLYENEPTKARCPHPCNGTLRVLSATQVDSTEKGVRVVCEKCGNQSPILARFCVTHSAPEAPEVEAKATALVPWVKAAMDVPVDQVRAVMPGFSALWGDKVSIEIKTLCARVALAYGLDPLAGELIVLGGKPYTTCQGRIRNAERHSDYRGFDTEWVVDAAVRKAMALKDGDVALEVTGYREGRRPCKAWGIVRAAEIIGGTNPIARSNPQEMAYKRGVERCLRHMYSMPLPGVEESPQTEADYYRQKRVDVVNGEVAAVVEGELNVEGCSAGQRGMIHGMVTALGITEDGYRNELQRLFGVDSSMKLTAGQASEYLDALTARIKAHQKGSPMAEAEEPAPEAPPTAEQLAEIARLGKELNWPNEKLRTEVMVEFSLDDPTQLSYSQAQAFISNLSDKLAVQGALL